MKRSIVSGDLSVMMCDVHGCGGHDCIRAQDTNRNGMEHEHRHPILSFMGFSVAYLVVLLLGTTVHLPCPFPWPPAPLILLGRQPQPQPCRTNCSFMMHTPFSFLHPIHPLIHLFIYRTRKLNVAPQQSRQRDPSRSSREVTYLLSWKTSTVTAHMLTNPIDLHQEVSSCGPQIKKSP